MIKFLTVNDAERKGATHQLLVWLRDDKQGLATVEKFHSQVLLNKGRISIPVRNGGLVSLYVNKVTLK